MRGLHTIGDAKWNAMIPADVRQAAVRALEHGEVLVFPTLALSMSAAERRFLNPAILTKAKNVSFNPANGKLGGTVCQGQDAKDLAALIGRYADAARDFLQRLLPYGSDLKRERTSLRPAAIAGRVTSWRKDDKLLHVDSFPSGPVQGRRLLRIFCNVNPDGMPRTWRIGEPFPAVAERFWHRLPAPNVFQRRLMALFRITKGLRSEYDHYMLQLHDAMKADADYQANAPQQRIEFPAGTAWACFTDQVSHAAMAGQHQFEQTFTLPVHALKDPSTAPLAVLERFAGHPLVPRQQAAA
jgi:hypothetical protein